MFANALARTTAAMIAAAAFTAGPAAAGTWDEDYFPNHTVRDQDGNSYAFYDDLVRGKIVVANFIYTTCTDICGLATARMAQVLDGLGERMGEKIHVYSISLTPEIDTPEQLKKYASAFGEVEGWKFLTGDPEEVKEIRWKLGERSRYLAEHRSDMVIGNDNEGYWRRISLLGNLANVTEEILKLDPEFRKQNEGRVARLGDQKRYVMSTEERRGESLFQKGCSGCHKIGGGDRIGPDLYGITSRRERDWLMRVLLEPNKLREEGDPEFTRLDAQYPNVLMPYLDLAESDARDVLAYLERRSAILRSQQAGQESTGQESTGSKEAHSHEGHDHEHEARSRATRATKEMTDG